MNGFAFGKLGIAALVLLTNSTQGRPAEPTHRAQSAERLLAVGIRAERAEDGSVLRFTVPCEWKGNRRDLDQLQIYCRSHAPSVRITFIGPVITLERMRQFQVALPDAWLEHLPAVGLGIVFLDEMHDSRLVVSKVSPNTSAELAGLEKGDLILGIGDYRWPEADSQDSFRFAMRKQIPGGHSSVIVKRTGKIITLPVVW
ncbi:PDZ domain-containing protein [Aureliella helgolandensis]|uniref:PDZ domain-containing protein n=1 Tax=Aureliella helgolandensis TaxID=2527968 RepID=A0A518G3A9_9BACT|nr:PDZ domain-containing protein [Aureliella helgolandensis]QDV23078.1 hypothetical protein Q31a_13730 [Aureliella helgolandensis]